MEKMSPKMSGTVQVITVKETMTEKIKFNTVEEAKQAAFNQSVRGLASQDWKRCARNLEELDEDWDDEDGVECAWNLGKPGFHCAIGWLIPWENQEGGSGSVSDLILARNGNNPPVMDEPYHEWLNNGDFIDFLQDMQDRPDINDPSRMKHRFILFGNKHKLEWPDDVSPITQ
jgi:hypothetical protein